MQHIYFLTYVVLLTGVTLLENWGNMWFEVW